MLTRFTILLFFISTSLINAQIYTPSGTIQGSSPNNNIGIGTNNPTAKLHINNGDNSYGAILANANESSFSLYTKTLNTNAVTESFRLGLKYLDNENNGFISFYRGGDSSGGFLGFSTNGAERIRISNVGNVGIGTNSPLTKLDVRGNISVWGQNSSNTEDHGQIFFENSNHGIRRIGNIVDVFTSGGDESGITFTTRSFNSSTNSYSNMLTAMKISANGNIGIGTSNPLAKLEIRNGDILVKNLSNANNSSAIMIGQSIVDGNLINFGTSIRTVTQNGGANTYGMQIFTQESHLTNQTEKVRIQGNGNVGIGTVAPDEKLTVKGKIHAEEVRIDLSVPAPDYVFASDYKLKTLQEIEAYIKQNNHLPEIPSAKEIEKNGLMLAEMNMSLLKKIEELTLYSIEQNKKTEAQAKEIEAQSKEIETLKDLVLRVTNIEKELAKK